MKTRIAAGFLVLVAGIGSASARSLFEREPWDQISNDGIGSAQYIGVVDGSTVTTVIGSRRLADFGDSTADFFRFDVPTPALLTLTVDTPNGPALGHDPVLGLFDSLGSPIAVDDDTGDGFDSAIYAHGVSPGTYYAAVSGYSDFGFVGGGSQDYPYALTLTAAVPEPGTYAMVIAGLGAVTLMRRRRSMK